MSRFLNRVVEVSSLTEGGKLFQYVGARKEKEERAEAAVKRGIEYEGAEEERREREGV